jgi:hypothetical protein
MKFMDLFWFLGWPGLSTLTVIAVAAVLATLLFQFRELSKPIDIPVERIPVSYGASILFVAAVLALR